MYAAGRPHPLRESCRTINELALGSPVAFCTDAEVLQELLHRYLAIDRRSEAERIVTSFAVLLEGRVIDVLADDVVEASRLAFALPSLSARDLLHVAILRRAGVGHIISADRAFDAVPGLQRLDPTELPAIRALATAP